MADAVRLAGYPRDKSEIAALHAGQRMEKHVEVRQAIAKYQDELLLQNMEQNIAELKPIAVHSLKSMLRDTNLNSHSRVKATELAFKVLGMLDGDGAVTVQVVQVGAQAREELRLLQSDGDAQRAALDELERLTIGGSSAPPGAKKFSTAQSEPAVLSRPAITLENGV